LLSKPCKAQIFNGSYIKQLGMLQSTTIFPESASSGNVPSISLDHHFEQSVPVGISEAVSYTGDVSIHGADRSFGISVDTATDVPQGTEGFALASISASVVLNDTWFADTEAFVHTFLFTAAWKVSGSLGANAQGEAPPAPFSSPYINANAASTVKFSASGDRPGSVTIAEGNPVSAIAQETYNNIFTNNSQPNPQVTQSTFPFPSQILLTFLVPNHGALGVDFEADVSAAAHVSSADNQKDGIAIAAASFGHTFTWSGITSVVDADTGQPITDWTLRSASGVDWAHASPEPSTWLLATLGSLAVLATRLRRCGREQSVQV
jgi:hypothetical protein